MKKNLLRSCMPATPAHFSARMEAVLDGIVQASPAGIPQRAGTKRRREGRTAARRRRMAVLLVAALLIAALGAAGFASGLFDSIFGRMKDDGFAGTPEIDYDRLEANAAPGAEALEFRFDSGARAAGRIEQAYYNGRQLIAAWACRPVGSTYRLYEAGDARYSEVTPILETDADGHQSRTMEIDLASEVGTAAAAEFQAALAKNGRAGIAWYSVYWGDSVRVEGVPGQETDFTGAVTDDMQDALLFPETTRDWWIDGRLYRYEEYATPLPEGARDCAELTLLRKLHAQTRWYYVDETGEYAGFGATESLQARQKVVRSDDYVEQSARARFDAADYTAEITLTRTPVQACFTIDQTVPERWNEAWASYSGYLSAPLNLPEDLVFDYEIWIDTPSGRKRISAGDAEQTDGIRRLTGKFLLPDEATAVIFRPIRANSGASDAEEIVLALD